MSHSLKLESGLSGPEDVNTTKIPITPKLIEAYINTLVAIFCIHLLYQAVTTVIVRCVFDCRVESEYLRALGLLRRESWIVVARIRQGRESHF